MWERTRTVLWRRKREKNRKDAKDDRYMASESREEEGGREGGRGGFGRAKKRKKPTNGLDLTDAAWYGRTRKPPRRTRRTTEQGLSRLSEGSSRVSARPRT